MTKRLTTSEFTKKVKELVNDEYIFLDDYVTTHIKLRVKHNICGTIYLVRPNDFISKGNRCINKECLFKRCSEIQSYLKTLNPNIPRKTNDDFVKEVYELVQDEYTFLEDYVLNNHNIKVRHNKCGHEYSVKPLCFLSNGRRCPKCSKSSSHSTPMKLIERTLNDLNVSYQKEISYKECKNSRNRYLYFDYLLRIKDSEDYILLEYDGGQHKYGWKSNKIDLERKKENDKVKTDFCNEYDITLVRISTESEKKIITLLKEVLENYCII
jgi:hypothetical protein